MPACFAHARVSALVCCQRAAGVTLHQHPQQLLVGTLQARHVCNATERASDADSPGTLQHASLANTGSSGGAPVASASAPAKPEPNSRRQTKNKAKRSKKGRDGKQHKAPLVQKRYLQLIDKARADPQSLTRDDMHFLLNGLPSQFRISVTPEEVIELLESDALTIDIMRQCQMFDLNRAISQLGRQGRMSVAIRLVDHLTHYCKCNQHTYAMFFNACADRGEVQLAKIQWEKWATDGALGPASVTALMKCVLRHDIASASDVFAKVHEYGVPVDLSCYNLVLSVYARAGRFSEALDVFGIMQTSLAAGVAPDCHTYNLMLVAIEKAKRWDFAEVLYGHMQSSGLVPDKVLSATFMKALAYAGRFELVESIFSDRLQHWTVKPDHWHFNALLMTYGRNGDWDAALAVFENMQETGVAPDSYTIVALLQAAARHTNIPPSTIDAVLAELPRLGIERNTYICAGMLQFYRTCALLPRERRIAHADREFAAMQRAGVPINAEVMNTLISLHWECGDVDGALALFDSMSDFAILPTEYTYSMLIMMCTEEGRLAQAAEFRELRATMHQLVGPPLLNSGKGRPSKRL